MNPQENRWAFEWEEPFVASIILELHFMLCGGGEDRVWAAMYVFAPQQKIGNDPLPRLHLCAQME